MRVESFVLGEAWAILPEVLEGFLRLVEAKASGKALPELQAMARREEGKASGGMARPGVAEIFVTGSLSKRTFVFDCGSTYAGIRDALEAAMADPAVKAVLLNVDSPGGTVPGVQDLAAYIRQAREKKPVYAWTDGQMTSAAYWLASASSLVAATETAAVGSIGVYVIHSESSRRDEALGIRRTIIKAGQYKAAGNDLQPLNAESLALIQERIDEVYRVFVADVAKNLGTSEEKALGMAEGRVYLGKRALDAGLVDLVVSRDRLLEMIEAGELEAEMGRRKGRQKAEAVVGKPGGFVKAGEGGARVEIPQANVEISKPGRGQNFEALVAARMHENGESRGAAIASVARSNPEAHREYLGKGQKGGQGRAKEVEAASGQVDAFESLVAARVRASGESRGAAIASVARSNPEAHQAYLAKFRSETRAGERVNRTGPRLEGDFWKLVTARMSAAGESRGEAIRHVARNNPQVHQSWLASIRQA